jgi:hypothetical protein
MPWETKDYVASYAAVLSTAVFLWTVGKEIIDRRRTAAERTKLQVGLHAAACRVPGGKVEIVLVLDVSNIGRDSAIITQAVAEATDSKHFAGAHKEPDAAYGKRDRVLPKKVEPGETVELQLFGPGVFRTQLNRIYVTDSEGRDYLVPAEVVARVRKQCEDFSSQPDA